MSGIIPKSKAKGIDICGAGENIYIIRSDLGCYMQTSDLNKGSDISVSNLHPACQNGDHYLGDKDGYFYIIRGNEYRKFTNLTTHSDDEVHTLHPNCQGGDHYFTAYEMFYIIFQEKGTYRITSDMNTAWDVLEQNLPPDCRNGLYYWSVGFIDITGAVLVHIEEHTPVVRFARRYSIYFLKPVSEWGVQFCVSSFNFSKDNFSGVFSVHHDVLNFLPGGLSVTKGPAFGIWENIKTISNDSNTPVTLKRKITKKVGWNKEKMTQITHNWKIDTSVSIETGALAKLITKSHFSFSAEYGGSHVSTENESCNEMTEEEEQLIFELKPKERLCLWQYRMGLGNEPVLFCRDLKITSDPNPPTEVPLPPAQSRKHIRML